MSSFYRKEKLKMTIGILVGVVFLWFLVNVFVLHLAPPEDSIVYEIKRGMKMTEIAKDLKDQKVIRSPFLFQAYAVVTGSRKKLQAGSYELSRKMSIADIVKKFVSGDVIKTRVTVIEGWTVKDIARHFEQHGIYSADDFLLVAANQDFSEKFSFLQGKPQNSGLEGYLFPDTYYISEHTTPEAFIVIALSNFDRKLTAELREEISRQGKSIFEIVTMASMIEREVRSLEDKKIVSGILWKRLGAGMPLQIDATVNYITGKNSPRVSLADTQIDSPYNTYKYAGLPRGPISNPGLNSILAAIYPEQSPYWYYISAKHNGETVFSRTLEEHNIAIAKYLNN